MISAIRLPRQLYVGFTFDGEIRTVELSYEFDYLNAFDEIRLRCDHSTWPGGPVSNNWSMHFSTTDMQRYLEDSIDTHTPLQDQPRVFQNVCGSSHMTCLQGYLIIGCRFIDMTMSRFL